MKTELWARYRTAIPSNQRLGGKVTGCHDATARYGLPQTALLSTCSLASGQIFMTKVLLGLVLLLHFNHLLRY